VTGILYVPSVTALSFLSLVEGGEQSDMRYIAGGGRGQLAPGVSIVRPPWGRITAIDLNTGEHVWMKPNGDTPSYVAERLMIDPSLVGQTGVQSRANLMVTSTLLWAGEGTNGTPRIWALDKRTGNRVAEIELPGTTTGKPMTFMHEGVQYIVVSVSPDNEAAELVALRLPQ
jgi:quinoprotein glucose dehydrogenase